MSHFGNPAIWTAEEDAVLRKIYPEEGSDGVIRALPHRQRAGINQRACRLKVYRQSKLSSRERPGAWIRPADDRHSRDKALDKVLGNWRYPVLGDVNLAWRV